jgi:hypothetical protein
MSKVSVIKKGKNKSFLCKLGVHKWTRWRRIFFYSSNVIDFEKKCLKCGEVRRKTEANGIHKGS